MREKTRDSEFVIILVWLVITLVEILFADHRLDTKLYYPEKSIYSLTGSLIGGSLFLLFAIASIKQAKSRIEKRSWILFIITVSSIMALRLPIIWLPEWAATALRAIAFLSICAALVMLRRWHEAH